MCKLSFAKWRKHHPHHRHTLPIYRSDSAASFANCGWKCVCVRVRVLHEFIWEQVSSFNTTSGRKKNRTENMYCVEICLLKSLRHLYENCRKIFTNRRGFSASARFFSSSHFTVEIIGSNGEKRAALLCHIAKSNSNSSSMWRRNVYAVCVQCTHDSISRILTKIENSC